MSEEWMAIINPVSGFGKASKHWPAIAQELRLQGIPFSFRFTDPSHHGDSVIMDEITNGYRRFISVGGDGNFHDLVNGLLKQTEVPSTDVTIAVVSLGTGNDWIRSSGVPKPIRQAVALIKEGRTMVQNAGKATSTINGQRHITYFHSFAGVGFDAYVVANTTSLKSYGQIAYLLGMAKCLFSYKKPVLRITVDDAVIETKCYMALAGIGQYGGGGMKLTPGASLNGTHIYVSVVKDLHLTEVFRHLPKLYDGSYTEIDKVSTHYTKKLKVEVLEGEAFMESDGDLLGAGPFEVELLEQVVKVVV